MPTPFQGPGLPLDQEGVSIITERLRITDAELWAVLTVETRGCGFLPDRRPAMLFERHVFSRATGRRFDGSQAHISNIVPGGYGAGGAHQYERLFQALALDRTAALKSASWGIGQVMGFNAAATGYANVEVMVAAMMVSENEQLLAMSREIIRNGLHQPLRTHHWAAFARGYNGSGYARNKYDTRLAAAYQRYSHSPLPDLVLRAAQMYLAYLGYRPGPIDGVPGRLTLAALHEFQQRQGLPQKPVIDVELLAILKDQAIPCQAPGSPR
jgi:hypothetical protein